MTPALMTSLVLAASAATTTLTLDDALVQAKERNYDLKVAQSRLEQARAQAAKVWANYLPQVSIGGSYIYNSAEAVLQMPVTWLVRDGTELAKQWQEENHPFDPDNPYKGLPSQYFLYPDQIVDVTIQPHHMWAGQAQLNQALFAPALIPGIQAATLGVDVAALSIEAARREVLLAVAQVYLGAVTAKEAVAFQEQQVELRREQEKTAQVQLAARAAPQVTLLRAQTERTQAEQELRRARLTYDSLRSTLAALLARDPDFDVTAPPEPPLPPDIETDEALRDRPDVQAARLNVDVAKKASLASKLAYLPTVGLNVKAQTSNVGGFTGEKTSWAATIGLNWALFDGGLREASLREANARRDEAFASAMSAEIKAQDEMRRARLDLESALANRQKAEEQARLAKEGLRLAQVSFDAGTGTFVELNDATVAARGAELAAMSERLNVQLATLKLAKAVGAFNP